MNCRKSSAEPLFRRNSNSFTQSIDSSPPKHLNVELLQPTIQEKGEEASVFNDNDCFEKYPHCKSEPDKYNTDYVTVSDIKSGYIRSTYDALCCNWMNYMKMLTAGITFVPVVRCINYPCNINMTSVFFNSSCPKGRGKGIMHNSTSVGIIFSYKVGSCRLFP